MQLDGKVAVVTGGGAGIGRAVCLELARVGARLAVVDLDAAGAEQTAALVREHGGEARSFRADVSTETDVRAYVEDTVQAYGRIDILFNNAGIEGLVKPMHEYPEDKFDQVMAVNVKGVFLGLKHVLPVMYRQRSGSIINTSSVGGLVGSPGLAAYVASKHAVIGLTRTAALEAAKKGVRVNAICPAPTHTRMMESIQAMVNPDAPEKVEGQFTQFVPVGRYGEPEEVARLVRFLASDDAVFITGAAVPIDGALTAI